MDKHDLRFLIQKASHHRICVFSTCSKGAWQEGHVPRSAIRG